MLNSFLIIWLVTITAALSRVTSGFIDFDPAGHFIAGVIPWHLLAIAVVTGPSTFALCRFFSIRTVTVLELSASILIGAVYWQFCIHRATALDGTFYSTSLSPQYPYINMFCPLLGVAISTAGVIGMRFGLLLAKKYYGVKPTSNNRC